MLRTFCVFAIFAWMAAPAQAATRAVYGPGDRSGQVIADNTGTADADFIWNLIRNPAKEDKYSWKRNAASANGQLSILCSRSKAPNGAASCEIRYQKLPGNIMEIIVSKADGMIGAQLTQKTAAEVRGQMAHATEVFYSPDKRIFYCGDCGADASELHLSWTLEPNWVE